MKAFVTGAAGFLGLHLCEALASKAERTIALVRDSPLKSSFWRFGFNDPNFIHVRGDVSDIELLERVLAEYEIDTVFHLAAQTQVSTAVANPVGTWIANIQGTWNLLEACRRQKTQRIIIASTDKAYGRSDAPYVEWTPLTPDRPYETSKACVDLLSRTYAATYGMKIAVTRCVNLYGPGHLNWSTLIPRTIRRIFSGQPPIVRDGGEMRRDWLYVEDAVDGYVRLAKSPYTGAMNFGTGKPTSVLQIVTMIRQLMDSQLEIINEQDNHGEIVSQWSTYDLAQRELEWAPRHTLADGLKKTIDWYTDYLHVDLARSRS